MTTTKPTPLSSMFIVISLFAPILITAQFAYAQQNNTELAVACQQEKDAMLAPDLPTDAYNNELPFYNSHCSNMTGALPQK